MHESGKMLVINFYIQIPLSEFELSYARSSGPGGQNVNKVNSKAILRWNIFRTMSLPFDVRMRVIKKLESKLTSQGEILITSDRFRDQTMNREDCFEKLRIFIAAAVNPPKVRKKTKQSRSSKQKLKESKSKHKEKKRMRRKSNEY